MSEVNEAQLLLGQAIQLGTLIGCECNRLGIDICTRKCNESQVWDLIRQARTLIQGEQVLDSGDSPAYGVSLGHPYYGQLMGAYERGQKDGAAPCIEHVSRSANDNELIALLGEVDTYCAAASDKPDQQGLEFDQCKADRYFITRARVDLPTLSAALRERLAPLTICKVIPTADCWSVAIGPLGIKLFSDEANADACCTAINTAIRASSPSSLPEEND